MNTQVSLPKNTSSRIGRIALGIAAAWFCVHAAIYAVGMCRLDSVLYTHLEHALKHFFGWQAAGFFVLAIVLCTRRPAAVGRALGGYLIGSTIVLLALSQDAVLAAKLAVLLLWMACAVEGLRQAIGRAAGERYATWGVAAAALYAALVPICFFLGVLQAITPSNVAALAVAAALPGAILWLRRLTGGSSIPRSDAPPANRQPLSAIEWCLLEVIWIVLAIEFIGASTIETSSDSVRVHLPYMLRVIADHGLSHQYACWYRLQPMAMQTCGAAIAAVGTVAAAKWFSWLALGTLVLLAAEEVCRRSGSRAMGLFAGAAVLGCPILTRLSTSLYIDHVITLLCTAGFVVLFRALRPPCLRGILLSAAIVGSMVQVKYTGLVFGVVWGLFLAVDLPWKCGGRTALRWSAAAGAAAALTALPWYVYVYLGAGNPVFPYLHSWFQSPYWTDDFTLQKVFEVNFKLSPGIAGAASFPWIATYHTASYVEGYDGILGFWALALAPCWFLAWRRNREKGDSPHLPERPEGCFAQMGTVPFFPRDAVPYWDMAIAGAAMIAGIVTYTPYIRYWMPAYPLLVASCVLAAGSLIRSIEWRPRGRWAPILSGIALASLLLLPAPLWCFNLGWDEYAKRISLDERRRRQFPGYDAVKRLNEILSPDDGVICTSFDGIYLVGGRPYEFAFWWNKTRHVYDLASFEDYCRRYDIRYWVVDHSRPTSGGPGALNAILAKYWTDARMVSASGTVKIYDLAEEYPKRWSIAERHEWPTALENRKTPWAPTDRAEHWVNLTKDAAASQAKDAILVEGPAWVGHRIEPRIPGGLCRVNLDVWSDGLVDPQFEITWYDAKGNLLSRTNAAAHSKSNRGLWIYALVPPNAKNGWVDLREWQRRPMQLKRGTVTFLKPQAVPPAAPHDKSRSETGGVR